VATVYNNGHIKKITKILYIITDTWLQLCEENKIINCFGCKWLYFELMLSGWRFRKRYICLLFCTFRICNFTPRRMDRESNYRL